MAARRDNVKELFQAVVPALPEAQKAAERQQRQSYAEELRAQIRLKEEQKRRERERALRQSRELLELRQGPAGGLGGSGVATAWKDPQPAKPAPHLLRLQAQPPAAPDYKGQVWHGSQPTGLRLDPVGSQHFDAPAAAIGEPWQQAPAMPAAAPLDLPPGYPAGPLQQHPDQPLHEPPWHQQQPLQQEQPRLAAAAGGDGHWQPGPGGMWDLSLAAAGPVGGPVGQHRLGPSQHSEAYYEPSRLAPRQASSHPQYLGWPLSGSAPLRPPGSIPSGYHFTAPELQHGAWEGHGGSTVRALGPLVWDRYGAGDGVGGGRPAPVPVPVRQLSMASQWGHSQPPLSSYQGDHGALRPLAAAADPPTRSIFVPGSVPAQAAWSDSGPAHAALPLTPSRAEQWGSTSPGKLAAFGADEEQQKKREGQRRAVYKAELEAQMQAKQEKQRREKEDQVRESLRKGREGSAAVRVGQGQGGYGGGSGPLRDARGNVVADLNQVRKYQQDKQQHQSGPSPQAALASGSGGSGSGDASAPAEVRSNVAAELACQAGQLSEWEPVGGGREWGPPPDSNSPRDVPEGGSLWRAPSGGPIAGAGPAGVEPPVCPNQLHYDEAVAGGGHRQPSLAAQAGREEGPPAAPGMQPATAEPYSPAAGRALGPLGGEWSPGLGHGPSKRGRSNELVVNLKSDNPFMSARDLERKQRQQAELKEALQMQMMEKRREKEEALRREKEEEAAEEERLRREQERLRTQFEKERGPGKPQQSGEVSGGAQTVESDDVTIKFKKTPAGAQRRSPQPMPVSSPGREGSPGVEIKYKHPPPSRLQRASDVAALASAAEGPAGRGQDETGGKGARGGEDAPEGGMRRAVRPAWPGQQPGIAAAAPWGVAPQPEQLGSGAASPGNNDLLPAAGTSADWAQAAKSGSGGFFPVQPAGLTVCVERRQLTSRGGQGGGLSKAEERYEAESREDSIRAALSVQRREMQELRDRAAAAEFHSSAARRQLEALADMVLWQGTGTSAGAPLAQPLARGRSGLGTGGAGLLSAGAALGAGSTFAVAVPAGAAERWGEGRQVWRTASIREPVPVYETITELSLLDTRPSTAAFTPQPPLPFKQPVAAHSLAAAAHPSHSPSPRRLAREDLVERSLAGTSALIFPPQPRPPSAAAAPPAPSAAAAQQQAPLSLQRGPSTVAGPVSSLPSSPLHRQPSPQPAELPLSTQQTLAQQQLLPEQPHAAQQPQEQQQRQQVPSLPEQQQQPLPPLPEEKPPAQMQQKGMLPLPLQLTWEQLTLREQHRPVAQQDPATEQGPKDPRPLVPRSLSSVPVAAASPRSLSSAPGLTASPPPQPPPLTRRATMHSGAAGSWSRILSPPGWLGRNLGLPPAAEGGPGVSDRALQPVSRQGSFSARRRSRFATEQAGAGSEADAAVLGSLLVAGGQGACGLQQQASLEGRGSAGKPELEQLDKFLLEYDSTRSM